jgi:hypothetical protein
LEAGGGEVEGADLVGGEVVEEDADGVGAFGGEVDLLLVAGALLESGGELGGVQVAWAARTLALTMRPWGS